MPVISATRLGVPRDAANAPIDDPVRKHGPELLGAGGWTPTGLTALGHQLAINVCTGGLTISAVDTTMPYHALPFQAARSYDAQEQHAQASYLLAHPNTDPRIHLFANWQSSREVNISPVWMSVVPELLVADGSGGSALYYRIHPDFELNTTDGASVQHRLRAYGIPGRTLNALGYKYEPYDGILRTIQGTFSILSGGYRAETFVDEADVRLFRFEVPSGVAYKYSSEFAYRQLINENGEREVTVPALVVNVTDSLGHNVQFIPIEAQPPYRSYRLVDGNGRSLRFELNDQVDYLDGNQPESPVCSRVITRVIDETGEAPNDIIYRYDRGKLVEVSYPGHAGGPLRSYRYSYDAAGNLTRISDPVGDWFEIEYLEDSLDPDEQLMSRLKVSRLVDAEGNEARYEYDHAAQTVSVFMVGAAGDARTVSYTYTEDLTDTRQRYVTAQTMSVTSGYSGNQQVRTEWHYSANDRYQVNKILDPLGNATAFEYNDFNQVTRIVDAADHARNYRYDVRSAPTPQNPNCYDLLEVAETNVDGDGVMFPVRSNASFDRYDGTTSLDVDDTAQSTHRIATQTNELGAVWSFGYDNVGSFSPLLPTETTDPLGGVFTRVYDPAGALLDQVDEEGIIWRRRYNPRGLLTALVDPNGNERTWSYDRGTQWLTATMDARGAAPEDPAHSVSYNYDDAGRCVSVVDPMGNRIEYAYFANRRVRSIARTAPVAEKTSFAYAAAGELTEITDTQGNTTFLRLDEAGRYYETYRHDSNHPSIRMRFDHAGHAVEMVDRNGRITTFDYDPVGRLVALHEPDWPADAPANAGKKIGISYDALGHRLHLEDSELPRISSYKYDPAGNLTSVVPPFGPTLVYTYDARNAVVGVQDQEGVIDIQLDRDAAGNLIKVTDSAWRDPAQEFQFIRREGGLVNNLYRVENPSGIVARFDYNENYQITRVENTFDGNPVAIYGYDYRNDGLIGEATGDHIGRYGYDAAKHLVQETDSGYEDGYDGAGNRLWHATNPLPPAQQDMYDNDNKLIRKPAAATTYSYDINGNNVARRTDGGGVIEYQYDGANRLRRVLSGGTETAYRYDLDGRLLERTRRIDGGAIEVARYVYINGFIGAEIDTNNSVQVLYTRSDAGRLLRLRGDALDPQPTGHPHSLFYIQDGHESTCRLLDWDGEVRLSVDYDAWGVGDDIGTAHGDLFRYRSSFADRATGLLRFGRRWYDPVLGRWMSQDPAMAEVLMGYRSPEPLITSIKNLYIYAGNNPLNFIDPAGLSPQEQGGWWDSFVNGIRGRLLAGWIRGQEVEWPSGRPDPTVPEKVTEEAPPGTEDEVKDRPKPPEEESPPSGGGPFRRTAPNNEGGITAWDALLIAGAVVAAGLAGPELALAGAAWKAAEAL
ncbi:RHS repeat-associated core domain-containing protein [Arthrobacter sp. NicSoilC5]|uniref:RHS repeat domain-containing protein n=1 Tax=Arthrobacter sp. NicSoilC5 TaxID=2831000 RepID=UPI001CC7A60D|nr:RHS repeat-associated core domain-containing protein [Arthrobacter sp. NicSoilC5]BCW78893.1 hypothetical protein NicSoilC5_09120 [Arthrobacter sp. NicSoilC5]